MTPSVVRYDALGLLCPKNTRLSVSLSSPIKTFQLTWQSQTSTNQYMKRVLPIIVIAQFFCTSLWFAGNAIMVDISKQFNLHPSYLAYLTSILQLGFIIGTLVFAILSISDRFSPSKVFFACATTAAIVNLGVAYLDVDLTALLLLRFTTGFFLAGIYPVGMKIASDYYQEGLGKSLGFLVGALVIGTAFPHLLKGVGNFPWHSVIWITSLLSLMGGLSILILVPDGPFRKSGQQLKLSSFLSCFHHKNFRSVAFGYFGHMWEQYSFWVYLPVILTVYRNNHPHLNLNIPLLSFFIIAVGCVSCIIGGFLSEKFGAKKVATVALCISGSCCLLSPIVFAGSSFILLLVFLLIWSMSVIADSPQLSSLVAQNAITSLKGTSITLVTCIGFAITIVSIQLISALKTESNQYFIYSILAIGPIFGLISLRKSNPKAQS